jgi:hypothetical protein
MVAQSLSTAAAEAVHHGPWPYDRHVRKLGIRPIEILMIEQNPQTAEKVLFAAAVKSRKMLRGQKAVPGDGAHNFQIAFRQLKRRRRLPSFEPLCP